VIFLSHHLKWSENLHNINPGKHKTLNHKQGIKHRIHILLRHINLPSLCYPPKQVIKHTHLEHNQPQHKVLLQPQTLRRGQTEEQSQVKYREQPLLVVQPSGAGVDELESEEGEDAEEGLGGGKHEKQEGEVFGGWRGERVEEVDLRGKLERVKYEEWLARVHIQ